MFIYIIRIYLYRVYFEKNGKTQKNYMELKNEFNISLNKLVELHKYWFNSYC